jgi:hypothetical protein
MLVLLALLPLMEKRPERIDCCKMGMRFDYFHRRPGDEMMHVFIAGLMQGSREDHLIDAQDYRSRITQALQVHVPGVKITDPYGLHPDSINYGLEKVRDTFVSMADLAGEADVLIAYLPQASMGTAIEMWTAFNANKYIIVVTPLKHNWVVRVTADEILPDLDTLLKQIENGRLAQLLDRKRLSPD